MYTLMAATIMLLLYPAIYLLWLFIRGLVGP